MKFVKGLLLGAALMLVFHIYLVGGSEWKENVYEWPVVSESMTFLNGLTDQLQHSEQHHLGQGHKDGDDQASASEDSVMVDASNPLQAANTTDHKNVPTLTIGMNAEKVEDKLGMPQRIDPSAYGYEWWIYNDDWKTYIQIGMIDEEVVTYYTNALEWEHAGLQVGMPEEEWHQYGEIENDLSFQYESGYYTLNLTEQDMLEKPVFIEDDVAVQLYIDIHEQNTVSGIRVMNLETLLLHRPYSLQYIGNMPDQPPLNAKQERKLAEAHEQQVLDIVNVSRRSFDLDPVHWHEHTSTVAKDHSRDMYENEYFDHTSPDNGSLGDRLDQDGVDYRAAGENIAWNYTDAPDAHHGWLNSPGHRKNVLEPTYTHLGVGVFDQYYTQNFIRK